MQSEKNNTSQDALLERLERLEAKFSVWEERADTAVAVVGSSGERSPSSMGTVDVGDDFWPLTGLQQVNKRQGIEAGQVMFAGEVNVAEQNYLYQWQRETSQILSFDWADNVQRLEAICHPQRAAILKHILEEPATVAQLIEVGVVGSQSTAYNHLGVLSKAGWVAKDGHGIYAVRPSRVVPLLVAMIACDDH